MRRERGFSARRLAECMDVSEMAVRHWQSGFHRPHPKNLRKLELALGCGGDALLETEDGPITRSDRAASADEGKSQSRYG
jgi:transcriptional regulator with XRE-family HTH domain